MGEPTVGSEYRALHDRVAALIGGCDDATLEAPSPATPDWRVRDVLAHMVGVVDDALNQNFEGAPFPPWTAAQVAKRRDRSVADMLDEWDQNGRAFEAALETVPFAMSGQALYDAVTHEHDIRCALGVPGARDVPAVSLAFDWIVEMRTVANAPALRFDMGDTVAVAGTGDVIASIGAPRFEIIRAMTGRRSASEIAQFEWDRAPDLTLLVGDGSLFQVRAEPLRE